MPRKKQRRPIVLHADYHVQITGWEWDYSFTTNVQKYEDRRFSEHRHLLIRGLVLRPRGIKAETAELWFFPDVKAEDFEQKRDEPPPKGVGSLSIEGPKSGPLKLVGYLSMPEGALEPVKQMLIADRFKFVLTSGEAMRWRRCFIQRYEFTAQHDEADYPEDE